MAALLTAVGVTEIYRLNPDDAFRQGLWIVVGVARLRRDAPAPAPRLPAARELQVPLRARRRSACSCCPALPGIGATVNGARLWVHVGALQFQPGELAKIMLIVFLAGYLREKREVLAQGRLKDFGPLLVIWGARDARPRRDERPRERRSSTSGSSSRCSTSPPARACVRGAGLVLVRRRRDRADVHQRVRLRTPGRDRVYCLARPVRSTAPRLPGLPDRPVALLDRERRLRRHRASAKATFTTTDGHDADPVPEHRLHLLGARPGARAGRRGRAAARLHALRASADCGSRSSPTTASRSCSRAGLTFGFALQTFIIVGGVLRFIPLTGITLPFVSLRRLERRRELRPARGPPARLEPRQPRPLESREQADQPARRRRRSSCCRR